MTRGSFGRSVARAAASGGSKSYRARPPVLWYTAMVLIVLGGVGLIVYSRNEKLHPALIGPTASDNWNVALAIDICGTVESNLPANTNLTSVGLRTFGDGLINVDPAAVTTGAASYEGANATLGKFASSYPGLKLTATSIALPARAHHPTHTYANGDRCTAAAGHERGRATLQAKLWSSPTVAGKLVTGDLTALHLDNGEMITVAFVPKGAPIPVPPSRPALAAALGTASGSTATTTSAPSKKG